MVTFHQVGQALFASEQYAGHTIVYDCGGERVELVNNAIDTDLPEDVEIDILFISHYDRDHVNGILHLLKTHKVKHVILPLVSDFSRFISYSSYPGNKYDRVLEFYKEPKQYIENISPNTKCHYQSAFDSENNVPGNQSYTPVQLPDIIPFGSSIIIPEAEWLLKPFHRKYMTIKEENEFMKGIGLDPDDDFATILSKWPVSSTILKKELIRIGVVSKSDINDYSMTLYSQNPHSRTLYLGDYNARKHCKELVDEYCEYWGNITCLQVPHHGSIDSFNDDLFGCGANDFVISNKLIAQKTSDINPQKVISKINQNNKTHFLTDNGVVEI